MTSENSAHQFGLGSLGELDGLLCVAGQQGGCLARRTTTPNLWDTGPHFPKPGETIA